MYRSYLGLLLFRVKSWVVLNNAGLIGRVLQLISIKSLGDCHLSLGAQGAAVGAVYLSQPLIRKHTFSCLAKGRGQGGGANTISAPERCNCRSVNCCTAALWAEGVMKDQVSLCGSTKASETYLESFAKSKSFYIQMSDCQQRHIQNALVQNVKWIAALWLFVLLDCDHQPQNTLVLGWGRTRPPDVACFTPQLRLLGCHFAPRGSRAVSRGGLHGRVRASHFLAVCLWSELLWFTNIHPRVRYCAHIYGHV